jgi:hypothetical protein
LKREGVNVFATLDVPFHYLNLQVPATELFKYKKSGASKAGKIQSHRLPTNAGIVAKGATYAQRYFSRKLFSVSRVSRDLALEDVFLDRQRVSTGDKPNIFHFSSQGKQCGGADEIRTRVQSAV